MVILTNNNQQMTPYNLIINIINNMDIQYDIITANPPFPINLNNDNLEINYTSLINNYQKNNLNHNL